MGVRVSGKVAGSHGRPRPATPARAYAGRHQGMSGSPAGQRNMGRAVVSLDGHGLPWIIRRAMRVGMFICSPQSPFHGTTRLTFISCGAGTVVGLGPFRCGSMMSQSATRVPVVRRNVSGTGRTHRRRVERYAQLGRHSPFGVALRLFHGRRVYVVAQVAVSGVFNSTLSMPDHQSRMGDYSTIVSEDRCAQRGPRGHL